MKKKLLCFQGRSLKLGMIVFAICNLPLAFNASAASDNAKSENFPGNIQSTVSGTVSDAKGEKLPGVSVKIKGSASGSSTDANGRFSISAPANSTLVFTYIGFVTKEVPVGSQTTLNVVLIEESTALNEVVVTALGIKRESKRLGYATATVSTDQLSQTRTTNLGNSLQGKVAGVNISAPPSGPGGSSKIRIRGQSSFGGDNSPLIIVNGIPINNSALSGGGSGSQRSDSGDGLQSINPDDIESMTVLKGAPAAALYGSRAKDGAIIITTKTGTGQTGIGVEVTSNFQADEALDFTDFQYEYGMGEYGQRATTQAQARQFGTFAFGSRIDGSPSIQVDGNEYPYVAQRNNIKNFFGTGLTSNNSVAVSGGNDKGNFRLSFTNTDSKGIMPNSSLTKKLINIGLNYNLTKNLTVQLNGNYSNEYNKNPPIIGQQELNVNSTLFTMANTLDVNILKDAYQQENGDELTISRFLTRSNPYWVVNKRFENSRRDRLFGNASVRYQFTPWLYAQGRIGQDFYSRPSEWNRPTGTGYLTIPAVGFNGNYFSGINNFRERNLDFLVGANKQWGIFGLDATVGGNAMKQVSSSAGTTVTSFYVRDLYAVGNGVEKNPAQGYNENRINSLYGSMELSFKTYLYLNLTGRNDWFSTLNPASNNYFYPSASLSFVLSEALGSSNPSWLNYAKLRGGYAEVGGGTGAYQNILYYNIANNPFNGIGLGSISGGNAPNAGLKPLKVKEAEVGMELRALDSRINLDFAVYRKNTVDEILDVSVSNTSGYTSTRVNVGKLRNQGVEALLTLVPVKNSTFNWESAFNAGYNISKVISLADNQTILYKNSATDFIGRVAHEVGQPLGSLRWFDYRRDDQGRILTNNGLFQQGVEKTFGSALPTWTGGWLNTFKFKDLRLFTQIDFKAGNKMISSSNYNMYRHGLHKGSLPGREGGVVFDGVNADGTPNTTAVEAEQFYTQYRTANVGTPFVYNAGFIRFRTVSLGYDLTKHVNKTFIKGMNINAFVNNVFFIKKHVDNIDPEGQYSTSDDASGLENHALPTTRSYGLNLNVKF